MNVPRSHRGPQNNFNHILIKIAFPGKLSSSGLAPIHSQRFKFWFTGNPKKTNVGRRRQHFKQAAGTRNVPIRTSGVCVSAKQDIQLPRPAHATILTRILIRTSLMSDVADCKWNLSHLIFVCPPLHYGERRKQSGVSPNDKMKTR